MGLNKLHLPLYCYSNIISELWQTGKHMNKDCQGTQRYQFSKKKKKIKNKALKGHHIHNDFKKVFKKVEED